MNEQKVNTGDVKEVAVINRRLTELTAKKEQLLYSKQVIPGQLKSQQPQTLLTTEQKISLFQKLYSRL